MTATVFRSGFSMLDIKLPSPAIPLQRIIA
jgi:hypothetical protein